MSDVERYQALMLEHLYGLLEPDEVRELEAFLTTPEGAPLRATAEGWKARIGAAARVEFPRARFVPPAEAAPARPLGRPTMSGVWTRWVVAACLLVVLGGLGGPAAFQFAGWYSASREADQAKLAARQRRDDLARLQADQQARREALSQEHEQANAALRAAEHAYQEALAGARKAIEQKDFVVRLRGPERVLPGAPNEWQIDTLTKSGGYGSPKKIDVVVKDQKDTVLLRESHDQPHGSTPLKLPTAFWDGVKPGSDLFLEVVAYADDNRRSVLAERVPLARPVYVTHLVTDKPLYKPGEVVRFRSLTLDRATFLPPDHDLHLQFRLRNPDGAMVPLDDGNGRVVSGLKPVVGPDGKPVRGIGVGEHELEPDAPGGEYTLEVAEIPARGGRERVLDTRKFLVTRYVPEVFEKKLEFDGKSYGPGDPVQARVEVSRTAGGPMKDARGVVIARVDGREIHAEKDVRFRVVADPQTRQPKAVYDVRFKLPADLYANRGKNARPVNAVLEAVIQDGSDAENILRPIPLVEKDLKVEFFPEGGDLVEAVPGRVYFQVRTPAGKPADLKGVVTDGTGTVAEVSTVTDPEHPGVNRGQGVFTLTPQPGKKYFLKLRTPVGIIEPAKDGFPLPEVKPDGVVLTALDAATERGEPIRVRVQSARGPKTLHVGAYARGQLIGQQRVEVEAGKPVEVKLQGDEAAGGVTRVTVFEEPKAEEGRRANLLPRAERLVYRKPGEQLRLTASPDRNRYAPAARVALELAALTEKERPTPAILLVGVVNQGVIAMADSKTDRLLPTHFLLAGDVKDPAELEHADFLLTDHPKAAVSLDLLLGTQGWRRFAEQNIFPANPAERREVEKMLVAHGRRATAPLELYRLEEQRVASEFRPKVEQAGLRAADAEVAWAEYKKTVEPLNQTQVANARSRAEAAESDYQRAAAELYQYESGARKLRSWGLPTFLVGLLMLAAGGIAVGIRRQGAERRRFLAAAGGSFALAGLVMVTMILTHATADAQRAYVLSQQQSRSTGGLAKAPTPAAAQAAGGADKEMAPKAAAPQFAPVRGGGGAGGGEPLAPAAMDAGREPANADQAVGGAKVQARAVKPGDGPPGRMRDGKRAGQGRDVERDRLAAGAKIAGPDRGLKGEQAGMAMPAAPGMPPPRPPADAEPAVLPFIVREYAHQRDPTLPPVRSDFTETVYWHPVLVLPDSGRARVEFQLSDDIARYQVLVAGHTTDGRIGAVTKTIEARKPFAVDPKLPAEVTSSDVIDVAVRVVNDSDDRRAVSFTLSPTDLGVEGTGVRTPDGLFKDSIDLGPNGKGRKVFRVRPTRTAGHAALTVVGNSDPAAEPDAVARTVRVVPEGFPVVGSVSDLLEKRATGTVELPKDVVIGTLRVRLELYPTSMADLLNGLDGLLREPNGCFEQTSTSNYPNTLILDYLNSTNQAHPEAARRAKELLDRGYARLTSFECPDTPARAKQGFEWFGAPDMAHEALTAYGLLQFKDMARVHAVDPEMIRRTQAFLLSRRDGTGGFRRNPRALDSFGGAPKHTTDAYIAWALVESDPDDTEKLDLKRELTALKTAALNEGGREGKDAYFVALTANALLLRGDRDAALALLDRLKDKHVRGGAVTGAETSITRSGGRDLDIETTALAMLGWLRANEARYAPVVKDATKWISQQRGGAGGFGSTQSTILALKALTLHARKSAHPAEAGEVRLLVNGKPAGVRKFSERDVEVIGLDVDGPDALFPAGAKTEVEVQTDARHPYPFALSYTYTTLTPAGGDRCAVRLEPRLGRAEATEGETVPLTVTLQNRQKQGQGMAVAVVGLPAGLKVPADMKQLTDLREKGVLSFFEVRGRELVLYWRELAPEQKVELTVDLVCDVPGQYRGPASRGYLYYDADHKHWAEPLAIRILPAAPRDEAATRD